jgi:hypothetical protein
MMKVRYISATVRLAATTALGLVTALAGPAAAQDRPTIAMDGHWHFAVAPYFWFSGVKGDVSVRNLPEIPVEKSFSDIWSDFQIGALAHFEGRKDRWGFATDLMYMDLRAPVASGAPVLSQLDASATVKAFTGEGLGFYRAVSGGRKNNPAFLDVLAGARYYKTSGQLNVTLPAAGATAGGELVIDWVDAMSGVRFRAPLGSRVAFVGRGDVAGFGSKFTWNLEGDLAVALSQRWTLGAGWRHLSIDYDKGTGTDRRLMDVAYDGPRAWFAYAW